MLSHLPRSLMVMASLSSLDSQMQWAYYGARSNYIHLITIQVDLERGIGRGQWEKGIMPFASPVVRRQTTLSVLKDALRLKLLAALC